LDVGCGTGAMVEVFSQHFTTLGIDGSQRMLDQAHNRFPIGMYQQVDFTQGLPFEDKSFDLVYASFVLHGIPQVERSALLEEMKRVSQQQVIIFDYHHGRNILIDSVEYLEQGDYFNFINTFESEFKQMFSKHTTLPLNKYSELYVGDVT
jgi:ubiquinone/menaquinone biosynthesis C-methylase UbiE